MPLKSAWFWKVLLFKDSSLPVSVAAAVRLRGLYWSEFVWLRVKRDGIRVKCYPLYSKLAKLL